MLLTENDSSTAHKRNAQSEKSVVRSYTLHRSRNAKPLLGGPFTPSHPSPGITDQKLPQVHITSKRASITRKKKWTRLVQLVYFSYR